jgi:DNA modification methylase
MAKPTHKDSPKMPGQIEVWPIDSVAPYAKNSRTHSAEQVAQVAASMREFGFTIPLLVDEAGQIIAGHCRLEAARSLGMAEIPVMVADGWSEAQKRAYVIADNKLAMNAGWDEDLLRGELAGLREFGFDISLTGFGLDELSALFDAPGEGLTHPDEAPEPPANPVSALGDVWVLGRHRLVCGDSTNAKTVLRALDGAKPHLMVTDPPYGVDYDPAWRNRADRANGKPYGARAIGLVTNDDRSDWRAAWQFFHGDVLYCWSPAGSNSVAFYSSIVESGFEIRMQIIWAKSHFPIGRGHYHVQHEPCWYAVRTGATGHWAGDRKQTTLWQIDKPQKSETGHSTQKPVECMRRPIENNSKPGDSVYEPFSGSGTTIIAGEMTGRTILAIELDPAYIDVAVLRWQNYTGKSAVLEETGQTFLETMAARKSGKKAAAPKLLGGLTRKGGHNPGVSQIVDRPPAPASMKAARGRPKSAQPWIAAGVPKATWYRQKKERERGATP